MRSFNLAFSLIFFVACGAAPEQASSAEADGAEADGADTTEVDGTPDVAEPDADKPDVAEPDAPEPDAAEPDAAEPDAAESDTAEPDAAEPDAAEPDAAEPDAAEPDAVEPDAGEPDAGEPDAAEPAPRGTCSGPADCGGRTCHDLHGVPGSYFTCATGPSPLDECLGDEDEFGGCCSASDCGTAGECFAGPLFYCGGVEPMRTNFCLVDACTTSADCAAEIGGLCLPAGAFREPVARCVYSPCDVDADCTEGAGGECRPFTNPCSRRFAGFSCTYDDSACRSGADCPRGDEICSPTSAHQTECVPFFPPP